MPKSKTSPDRIISLAHLSALELAPPHMVRLAADAGFDHVSLRLSPAKREEPWHPMVGNSPMRRETKQILVDTGLRVPDAEVMTIYPDCDPQGFLPLFEAMQDLEIVYIIVNSEDPDLSRFAETMAQLCAAALPFCVNLGIEFMRYRHIKTLDQAIQIVQASGAPNASLVIDSLHFFRAGHQIADLAHIPPGLVSLIQLADAPTQSPPFEKLREEAIGNRKVPGEGDLPLVEFLAALPADLPVSVEVPSNHVADKSLHARTLLHAARDIIAAADMAR